MNLIWANDHPCFSLVYDWILLDSATSPCHSSVRYPLSPVFPSHSTSILRRSLSATATGADQIFEETVSAHSVFLRMDT